MTKPNTWSAGLCFAILFGVLAGCNNDDDSSSDPGDGCDCSCGDVDGSGGDSGDMPNLLGAWTSSFGDQRFFENCHIEDLHSDSERWINSVLTIAGQPLANLEGRFEDEEEERFYGVVSGYGGVAFAGTHSRSDGHLMKMGLGGLLYSDEYRDYDVIEGFVYLGVDLGADGAIDCEARGDWSAKESTSPEGVCLCDCDGSDQPDTEDVPVLPGSWSSIFGTQSYDDSCQMDSISQSSETWINGAALHVGGYEPDGLYAYFGDDGDERFYGVVGEDGSVVFSGLHAHSSGYTMHVAFGGVVYADEVSGRDVIEGFGYMGVDITGDNAIECDVRGQWQAMRSGTSE